MTTRARMPNDGIYLHDEFVRPWTLKDRVLVSVVYIGMLLSLVVFAAGLLGLVWAAGLGARMFARWMGW